MMRAQKIGFSKQLLVYAERKTNKNIEVGVSTSVEDIEARNRCVAN